MAVRRCARHASLNPLEELIGDIDKAKLFCPDFLVETSNNVGEELFLYNSFPAITHAAIKRLGFALVFLRRLVSELLYFGEVILQQVNALQNRAAAPWNAARIVKTCAAAGAKNR